MVQDWGLTRRASRKVTKSVRTHWSKPLLRELTMVSPVECRYSKTAAGINVG
jgi:hypothetical protein